MRSRLSPAPAVVRGLLLPALLGLLSLACTPYDGGMAPGELLQRQLAWLVYATEEGVSPGSIPNVMAHLERELRDPAYTAPAGAVPDDAWDGVFDKMWRLRDTSDFDALRLVNLLTGYRGHPIASEALWQKAEDALLTFKYWYRDPTPERTVDGEQVVDDMWYWTENHVLIFRVCEYLAGQLFPDRVFEVTGLTGAQHKARAEPEILRWLDERARFGFTEWHSNVYYNLDMRPLLALVEWADDETIARRASMVLDLVMLDVALHLHRGTFGATHGRSYIKDKASASTEDTFDPSKLLFDDTDLGYSGRGSASGLVFARARRYRIPEVIRRIARSDAPLWDRERMNLPLDEVPPADPASASVPEAPFGLDYLDEENLPFWWSMGSQAAWMNLPLTLTVGNRDGLFDAQLAPAAQLNDIVWNEDDVDGSIVFAWTLANGLWPLINEAVLKEVNTATYRTAHYMLSTAQDYRKGVRGSQTHTWQATLSERAMVFTQHPGKLPLEDGEPVPANWNWQREDEPGPAYWTGEGSQPRAAQHRNVTIAQYAPQYTPQPALGYDYRDETHAYFPVAHFDEVVQDGSWTFGRKDDGYVALYSWRETAWRSGQPEVFQNAGLDFDLVAAGGADNVWITECGSLDEWPGGFAAFRSAVAASAVEVTPRGDVNEDGFDDGFEVVYASPSLGPVSFGWEAPLVVDGAEQPISGYKRMDNRFAQVEFGSTRVEVADGEFGLVLDFETTERSTTAPAELRAEQQAQLGDLWEVVRDRIASLQP